MYAKLTVPCKEMSKLRSDIWKIWEFSLGLLSRARIRSVWHSLCFCFLTSWVQKHRKAVLSLHRQFNFLFTIYLSFICLFVWYFQVYLAYQPRREFPYDFCFFFIIYQLYLFQTAWIVNPRGGSRMILVFHCDRFPSLGVGWVAHLDIVDHWWS